ncbi:Metallopeptidase, catalytic domain superfamily [Fusarium oxysporum f. sp. vasinfectum]|nr:Metallopeptidase, catalytic domain superfamily [Fusarium oxysporum f. sp. vasinfectum]
MVSKLALALFFGNALAGLAGRAIPPRCAIADPTPEQVQHAQNLKKIESVSKVAATSITVDTYFHLRQGDYKTLNLYFTDVAKLDGLDALGYCFFPEPNVSTGSSTFIRDGCVIVAETVPGGSMAPYNLGGTAVHEVGHWFNLFHTFQDGCTGGDLVSDTPAQASQTSGCPARRDSCPNQAGDDPIHNFMDYSDDVCYEEFTPGQKTRMHSAWTTYRK